MVLSAEETEAELAVSSLADLVNSALVLPQVFVGHKGDTVKLAVYRDDTKLTATDLAGATGLTIDFVNLDGVDDLDITTGVAVGTDGDIEYTITAGDGVFENAGTWEYQARGTDAGGEPFKSQKARTLISAVVP